MSRYLVIIGAGLVLAVASLTPSASAVGGTSGGAAVGGKAAR
jgi:hypothetical protein